MASGNGEIDMVETFPIDMRSDLVTRPTPAILDAMTAAAKQPHGFGLREDTQVRRLEMSAAKMLGKDDAIFLPSCTMANQIAIQISCRPGDTALAEVSSHVIVSEAGAPAAVSGVTMVGLQAESGRVTPDQVADVLDGPVPPKIIVLENTHTRSGGSVLDQGQVSAIAQTCRRKGVRLHLDGARLANAAAATDSTLLELAEAFDTVALSLNKGMCAPVGALLAGRVDDIARADRVRQWLGGGWRPATLLAAGGIAALEDWREHLVADHRRAKRLADSIASIPGSSIVNDPVETNIVLWRWDFIDFPAGRFVDRLQSMDVLVLAFGLRTLRLVTHREIDDGAIERAASALAAVAGEEFPKN